MGALSKHTVPLADFVWVSAMLRTRRAAMRTAVMLWRMKLKTRGRSSASDSPVLDSEGVRRGVFGHH